jgi:hypothetical protein
METNVHASYFLCVRGRPSYSWLFEGLYKFNMYSRTCPIYLNKKIDSIAYAGRMWVTMRFASSRTPWSYFESPNATLKSPLLALTASVSWPVKSKAS